MLDKLKSSVTYKSCYDVDELCKPLRKMGINYFNYVRIYKDDTRLSLINNQSWIAHFFENLYFKEYLETIEENIILNKDDYYFLNLWDRDSSSRLVTDAMQFDIFHGISLIRNHEEKGYRDFYHFGSSDKTGYSLSFHINNIEVIKKFSFYFMEQAKKMIDDAEADKWTGPGYMGQQKLLHVCENGSLLDDFEKIKKETLNELQVKRYDLGHGYENKHLTQKEFECLLWAAKGKSAEEIGVLLNSSARTIEVHFNSIKRKFCCYKISEAIYKAAELGIIFLS